MAAATSGDMAAVIGEFFCRQPISVSLFEQHRMDLFEFVPIARGQQVHFENSGIGSEAKGSQPWIGRIALEPYRLV